MTKPSLHHLQYRVVLQSIYNEKKTSTAHSEVLLTQVGSANNAFYVSVKYYLCLRHRSSLTQLPKNNTLTDLRRMFPLISLLFGPKRTMTGSPSILHMHTHPLFWTPLVNFAAALVSLKSSLCLRVELSSFAAADWLRMARVRGTECYCGW